LAASSGRILDNPEAPSAERGQAFRSRIPVSHSAHDAAKQLAAAVHGSKSIMLFGEVPIIA